MDNISLGVAARIPDPVILCDRVMDFLDKSKTEAGKRALRAYCGDGEHTESEFLACGITHVVFALMGLKVGDDHKLTPLGKKS